MPTGPTGPASTASAEPTRGGSGVTSRPSSRELIARQASRTGNHAGPLHEAGRVSKAAACWACDACAGCPPRLPTFGSRTMTSRTGRNPRVRTTRTTHRTERPWIHPPKDLHHARRSDRPLQTIMHDPLMDFAGALDRGDHRLRGPHRLARGLPADRAPGTTPPRRAAAVHRRG